MLYCARYDDTENKLSDDAPKIEHWPALPLANWRDSAATLHMWTEIIGKIRMTPRGMTTGTIPHDEHFSRQ